MGEALYRIVEWSEWSHELEEQGDWFYDEQKHVVLVPVEPCIHGHYTPHEGFNSQADCGETDEERGVCDGKPEDTYD